MKKMYCIFLFLVCSFAGAITYLGMRKVVYVEYYSILEQRGYVVGEDFTLSFDIYSKTKNSKITVVDSCQYLLLFDNTTMCLENPSVEEYSIGDYYLIRLSAALPTVPETEQMSQSSTLRIITGSYTLDLSYGAISFLPEDLYPLLSISTLFGSYGYRNKDMFLCGINLEITTSSAKLEELRLGGNTYGVLSKVEFDVFHENQMSIGEIKGYNPKRIEEGYPIQLKSPSLFIPLSYKEIYPIRSSYLVVMLDDQTYYIDSFDFMTNVLDPNDYSGFFTKGVITNA